MVKAGKRIVWRAAGAGILVVLLAAALLLPRLLNTGPVVRNLEAELQARYHIRAERIKLSLFPFPRILMYGVTTAVPDTLTATADAVSLHLKILPLLTGKFVPARIDLLNPEIAARLPEQTSGGPAKQNSPRLQRLENLMPRIKAKLLAVMPGVAVDARNCAVELYTGQKRAFFFREIDIKISLHAHRLDFELTAGKSNLWRALSCSGWVDPGTLKSSAELSLTGGNPRDLAQYLSAPERGRVGDSQIDMTVTFSADGPQNARADFTASLPRLSLSAGPRNMVMRNGVVTGALKIDTDGIDFSISRLHFDSPDLNLTASCARKYSDHSLTLNVDAQNADAATLHDVMLAVDSKNPHIRKIFNVLRKAKIPEMHFSSRASDVSGLKKLENFTINGSFNEGLVFAPKADLLVSNASGNVLVRSGILTATHLSGHTAGSSTSGGELKMALPHDDPMFHLDLPITADLSELPAVLNRVVHNPTFRKELAQIKDVAGKTQGRLVVDKSLKGVSVKVDTGPFKLSGRYGRLPEPVSLQGASFLLEGHKVTVASLTGKSGRSSFQGVNVSCAWGETKLLEVDSHARSVISMDLINTCMRTHSYWKKFLNAPPKGLLAVDSFRLAGPPENISKWVFKAGGSVRNVVFQNKLLNHPLMLRTGAFEIDRDQITLKGIQASVADSSLSISGNITGYLGSAGKVDLQLSGRLGPEGNKIAASFAELPRAIRPVSNLNLLSSHLVWDKKSKISFKGEMQLSAGPRVTVDLVKTPGKLSIKQLVIKDKDSDATISITSSRGQMDIGFSGTLSNKTADLLLTENKLLEGSVKGKFRAHLVLDAPRKSSAEGKVRISAFRLPFNLPVANQFKDAEIEAGGNKLRIKSALINWNGGEIKLTGSVEMAADAYILNIGASADSLDLKNILKSNRFQERKDNLAQAGARSEKNPWDAPVKGIIRVRTLHLSYGKLIWDRVNAQVALKPASIDVRLNQANLCGISTPGKITITPDGLNIALSLSAKDQNLESALTCFFDKKHVISGSYTLTGNLAAAGKSDNLLDSLQGDVELKAKDGRIFRFDPFWKIISLLNISEIYRGVLPDLTDKGCAYKSITAKGKIKNGKLVLSDSVVDGPTVKMVFRGTIDLVKQKVDMIALVAPFRTVQRMVDATPLMGKVLKDALVTLPVHVSGNLADPSVVPLSPSAVAKELLGVMTRMFKLPLTILQPLTKNGAAPKAGNSKQETQAPGARGSMH